jgi:hypothetical protein
MTNRLISMSRSLVAIAVAVVITGCSSGSRDAAQPVTPVAQAPKILGATNLAFDQDTTSTPQTIRIDDADTALGQLALTVATSDATLVPVSGIALDGNGPERTLRVTPAAEATGTATITLTVRDPDGLTGTATLDVRVNPVLVSFRTLATSSFNTTDGGMFGRVSGVTVQADVDDDAQAFDALLEAGMQ